MLARSRASSSAIHGAEGSVMVAVGGCWWEPELFFPPALCKMQRTMWSREQGGAPRRGLGGRFLSAAAGRNERGWRRAGT